jgi:acetyl esterase/lipase
MHWGKRIALAFVAVVAAAGSTTTSASAASANSGQAGSTCVGNDGGVKYIPPSNGEVTKGLGPDAPAYYEIGAPTGAFAGKTPKGEMIVIHGGGWHLVGKATVAFERRHADQWRDRGWETVNVDYRACADSFTDVQWFKQRVRLLHPNAPICAEGVSAGAHLALMLAATESDLACAIALGGPTDFTTIAQQTAYDRRYGVYTNAGPTRVFNLGTAAFGDETSNMSPRKFVGQIKARLLLASGERDPLIPAAQNTSLAKAMFNAHSDAYVDVDLLPYGPQKFVHTGTTQAALDDLCRRMDALVAGLSRKAVPHVLSLA